MAVKSITGRWVINTLSVVTLSLIAIGIVFAVTTRNYYYNAAKQVILSRSNVISGILIMIADDETVNFTAELRNLVENSDEKNRMEITAIDHYGRIALSSSGFFYTQNSAMPDYDDAIAGTSGTGIHIGRTQNGEKVMAMTVLIPYINSEYSAIRYVISLEQIDSLLSLFMLLFCLVALAILVFIMVSGFYFIKSIVTPVRQVGAAARRFAAGDMSTRIEKKSDDELGELCDVINYMADEIQRTEGMKNEFISSVSHELRTPLTAIKGWSETLMADDTDSVTAAKGMRVITSETERLSGMVEELLDFSRIQSGRLTLVKTRIDLLAELGEAVLIYTDKAQREGIKLIYDEPEMVPFVFGDRNRLKQVFINVIDNAIKYSDPSDSVTVSVAVEPRSIAVTVKDTGCGISKEDLPKIKTKFFKANLTRRGSGIGLAVADEIVTLHGGTLEVDSEMSVGTTVTVRLPVSTKRSQSRTQISSTMEFKV